MNDPKRHAGLLVFVFSATVTCASPAAADVLATAARAIGVLTLPQVFGSESCAKFEPSPVAVHRAPGTRAAFAEVFLRSAVTQDGAGGCAASEVMVRDRANDAVQELPTVEYAYEQPGAVVTARRGEWYEIRLQGGTGWVRPGGPATFIPLDELLRDKLLYLREGAVGDARAAPGGPPLSLDGRFADSRSLAVSLLSMVRRNGKLWVRVELSEGAPCAEPKASPAKRRVWLPFHGSDGRPNLWFHSRGC